MLFAVTIAVGLSAFTPAPVSRTETVWFLVGDDDWESAEMEPCENGPNTNCEKNVPGYGNKILYKTNSTSQPYPRP